MGKLTDKQTNNRPWLYKKGQSGNPKGRPKGKTLKEYCRDFLSKQTKEERDEFMEGMPKEIIWKMAEGNPDTKSDLTSNGETINVNLVGYGDNNTSQLPTKKVPRGDI